MPNPEEPVYTYRVEPVPPTAPITTRWDVPIPDDLVEAARQIAECVAAPDLNWQTEGTGLDTIEVVWLSKGPPASYMGDRVPGIRMTWHQGEDRYGLLIPVRDLIDGEQTVGGAAFDLSLAIDEPHHSPPDGTVVWFSEA